jgi:Sulfatase-modifying factor enzyme 1
MRNAPWIFGCAVLLACQAPRTKAAPDTPSVSTREAAAETLVAQDAGMDAASLSDPIADGGSGDAEPAASKPSEPTACAPEMKLVEGDYCTKVEQKCLVEWWAPQNRKRVCEQFEPPTRCVGDRAHKRFCIDTYAWPNQRGVRPEVMNDFHQAQVKCAAAGKRMCTETEWTFACEGPEMKPFPYGYVRDPEKCNGDHKWDYPNNRKIEKRNAAELARLWKGVPSGSQPNCISDFGVHDLPANNDEVVASEVFWAEFSSVNTGGPWYSGVRNQCRPKVYTHSEEFYSYFLGFRCCSNPDGQPNDPRTPKQIREYRKFERVEGLAGFTVEQMREKLRLKREGKCTCDAGDITCKTMCGTLLGPNAVDGSNATRVPHRSRDKISR